MFVRSTIVLTILTLGFSGAGVRGADDAPLASKLQPFVDRHTLAGVVIAVANKDKILEISTAGAADIAKHQPMKDDSVFWIASMTKPITAVAVMMLQDDGKLNVDDPIEKYLPEFKDVYIDSKGDNASAEKKKPSRKITIKDCLTHTSGMPFKSAAEAPTLDILPLRDAVLSYATTPLVYDPGTQFLYSNCGINTAGRIVEVVSGKSFEDFMDERLFHPLGMKETTYWPSEEQAARLAKTYKPNSAKDNLEETRTPYLHFPLTDRSKRYPMPGGGLFSTAHDVSRFCQLILGNGVYAGKRYLSEDAVRQMNTSYTDHIKIKDGTPNRGLGWVVLPKNAGALSQGTVTHGGALGTNMWVDPAKGIAYIMLVQHMGYANDDGGKIGPTFINAASAKYGK